VSASNTDASKPGREQTIYVVFRFDDYSARSNTTLEREIINAFGMRNISFTVGVIPSVGAGKPFFDPSTSEVVKLPEEKAEILRSAARKGVIEVAQHGFSHQNIGERGEFRGLDYSQQIERITAGKELLENRTGAKVYTFIPPGNAYDMNTIKALGFLRYSVLSAYRGGDVVSSPAIIYLPNTCGIGYVKQCIFSARKSPNPAPFVVVLFHQEEFTEVGEVDGHVSWKTFIELLAWLSAQDDVEVVTIHEAAYLGSNLGAERFRSQREVFLLRRYLPPSLWCFAPFGYYGSRDASDWMKKAFLKVMVAFYGLLFALSFGVSYVFLRFFQSRLSYRLCYVLCSLSLVAVITFAYLVIKLNFSWKGISVLICLLGGSLSLWLFQLRKRKSLPSLFR